MSVPLALIACPDRGLTRLVLLHVVIPSANSDPKMVHALPYFGSLSTPFGAAAGAHSFPHSFLFLAYLVRKIDA